MSMKIIAVATAFAAIVTGEAQARGVTDAQAPQAFFPLTTSATLQRIEDDCARRKEPAAARSDAFVTCEVPMGLAERIAARVYLGEPLAPAPRAFLHFSVAPEGPGVSRVIVSGEVEDGRSSPERRVKRLEGARFSREGRTILQDLGGRPQPF